jgi:hypothetical protein
MTTTRRPRPPSPKDRISMSIGFGSSCCVAPRWRSGIAKNREGHGSCAVRATSERSEVAPVLIVLPGVRENSSTLPKASPRSLVRDPHLGRRLRASEVGAVVGSALAAPYYGYGPYCPGHYYGPPPAYYGYPPPAPGYPPPAPGYPPPAPGYAVPQGASAGDPVAYCKQRYRSYNPQTGTYLGTDGQRHHCP